MSEFTELERTVLAIICDSQPSIAEPLHSLLSDARISERHNTGHGFYTSFDVVNSEPPITWPERIMDGPNAEVSVGDEILLMGFILWLEGGYPTCLEGFQYGTPAGDDIDLKAVDLASIRWIKPMR
ncbi:hypothetical protein [Brevundimonas diminuta]|uniref:hypothetical protein n=1 Tax=Brevundimonas diminuta TaxID=293 RepID=UPI001F57A66B|nr:hypothetical protein [Brevundimonas diminuta]